MPALAVRETQADISRVSSVSDRYSFRLEIAQDARYEPELRKPAKILGERIYKKNLWFPEDEV